MGIIARIRSGIYEERRQSTHRMAMAYGSTLLTEGGTYAVRVSKDLKPSVRSLRQVSAKGVTR